MYFCQPFVIMGILEAGDNGIFRRNRGRPCFSYFGIEQWWKVLCLADFSRLRGLSGTGENAGGAQRFGDDPVMFSAFHRMLSRAQLDPHAARKVATNGVLNAAVRGRRGMRYSAAWWQQARRKPNENALLRHSLRAPEQGVCGGRYLKMCARRGAVFPTRRAEELSGAGRKRTRSS